MDQSEKLDISLDKQENAILLAISLIIQGSRSVGDLTELLANIATDIRSDGVLNDEVIMTNLRNSTKELDLPIIRSNLEKQYTDLGITTTIPGFEKYINDFLSFTGQKPIALTKAATKITTTGATLNGQVNANDLSTIVIYEYGTSTDYSDTATAIQSPLIGHANTEVNVDIKGLTIGTLYHFRVKSINSQVNRKGICSLEIDTNGGSITFATLVIFHTSHREATRILTPVFVYVPKLILQVPEELTSFIIGC